MKFRRRNAPLLLLLVPFASALSGAQDVIPSAVTKEGRASERIDAKPSPLIDLSKPKYDVGTKDAPVDGKDGKPKVGPFVGSEKDQKTKSGAEDTESVLAIGKDHSSELVSPDGETIPAFNDGVMDDPNRELPKQGTTGTEGGVSEKDKARKAQEGQTGEKLEKKPDSPKEAPPLPLSEETKIKGEKPKVKDSDYDDEDDIEGLAGLEVSP
jgi:hypothetical protein